VYTPPRHESLKLLFFGFCVSAEMEIKAVSSNGINSSGGDYAKADLARAVLSEKIIQKNVPLVSNARKGCLAAGPTRTLLIYYLPEQWSTILP